LLIAILVQALFQVTLEGQQSYTHYWSAQVSGPAQGVTSQNAQSAAIGRQGNIQANLHQKI
jgi:hypothetical protein